MQASLKDAWNAEEEEGALKSERGGSWVGPAAPLGFKTWAHGNQRHLIDEINVSFFFIYIYICVCVFLIVFGWVSPNISKMRIDNRIFHLCQFFV